jgi:hypothetical protein
VVVKGDFSSVFFLDGRVDWPPDRVAVEGSKVDGFRGWKNPSKPIRAGPI